ncbi:MAG: lysophospholipid acyltransferase family protein [Gaiellales bacterium]
MTAPELERYDRAWSVLRNTLGFVTGLLLHPRSVGAEHIPAEGPVLIVSNHESWWDIPSIGRVQPRTIRYMAKAELFRVPLLGQIIAWGGAFPVRRGEADRDALRTVHEIVAAGGVVGIFIQGHRQAELDGAKAGAGRCAVVEDAMVVPAAIRGSGSWRPGRRVRIRFGPPRTYERGDRRAAQAYRETADELMAEIRVLYEQAV